MANEKEEPTQSWLDLLHDYTQDTTLHGIRYTTLASRYILRRVFWALAVLGVISLLIYLLVIRLMHFYDRPKAVNVEVTYKDKLTFPAVTLCNQNAFRLTAIHEEGLYDTFMEKYATHADGKNSRNKDPDACTEQYDIMGTTCLSLEAFMLHTSFKYVEVTLEGCKHLCENVNDPYCSVIIHLRESRSCILTQWKRLINATKSSSQEHCQNADIYKRTRCTESTDVWCDFESGDCEDILHQSYEDKDDWSRVQALGKIPDKDRTTESSSGYYFQMLETQNRPRYNALLVTSYRKTKDTCLQISYFINGEKPGNLSVYLKNENLDRNLHFRASTITEQWRILHIKLPDGVFRIMIEGQRPASGSSGIIMDDIIIQQCSKFTSSSCRRTYSGIEYMGSQSTTTKNDKTVTCESWAGLGNKLLGQISSAFLDGSPKLAKNYCRNPNGIHDRPFCYVKDSQSGRVEPFNCDVPFCECSSTQRACDDHRCLPNFLFCDGEEDCLSGSDEITQCEDKRKITCQFDDVYLCGYKEYSKSRVEWEYIPLADEQWRDRMQSDVPAYMKVINNGAYEGERAIFYSPLVQVEEVSCLEFEYITESGYIDVYLKNMPDALGGKRVTAGSLQYKGTAMVNINPGPSKKVSIAFEATVQSFGANFIAIANIRLKSGLCNPDLNPAECKDNEFKCFDKTCIKGTLTCNGVADCPGGDDEITPCDSKIGIACDFSQPFMCGYTERSTYETFSWMQEMDIDFQDTDTTGQDGDVVRYTLNGDQCEFPFTLNGVEYNNCISLYANEVPHCDYEYCQPTTLTVRTNKGTCVFPFVYNSKNYYSCLRTKDGKSTWCAITDNYDRDKKVGTCESSCGGIFKEIKGTIRSPDYPSQYPPAMYCHYLIQGPEGATVSAQFLEFQLEKKPYSGDENPCYDYINIHDGEDFRANKLVGPLCGNKKYSSIVMSTGRHLSVYFYADNMGARQGFVISYEIDVPDSIGRVMVSQFTGDYVFAEAQAYLESPVMEVPQESCLTFDFISRTGLTVTRADLTASTLLLHTDMDHGKSWHRTSLTIKPGTLRIRFNNYQGIINGGSAGMPGANIISAVDNIILTPGSCVDVSDTAGSLECDFEDADMCGYTDASSSWSRWTRVKRGSKYFMVAQRLPNTPDEDITLVSGTLDTPINTCVTFSMIPNSTDVEIVIEFWKSDEDQGFQEPLWTEFSEPTVFKILTALASPFRLALHLDYGSVLLESISINGTNSDQSSCNSSDWGIPYEDYNLADYYEDEESDVEFEEEYPWYYGYDGSGDVSGSGEEGSSDGTDEDEDELITVTSGPPTEEADTQADTNADNQELTTSSTDTGEEEPPLVLPTNNIPIPDVNLSDVALNAFPDVKKFYIRAGHQSNDFIYRCLYSARGCEAAKLRPVLTDQGYCVSFNDQNENMIQSYQTGSGFGLKLTLNVEQYEYINGPNTDAGIKMYLHHQEDVPAVRDLGFAVAPGVHGLVAATFSKTLMLPDPYGDCGVIPLNLTSNEAYTYHRCQRECETIKAYNFCKCIDAYMPGKYPNTCSNAGEQLRNYQPCSLEKYLDCIYKELPTANNTNECGCPDACDVVSYGSELSYAELSSLSVNNILTQNATELQSKYQHALEIRHRVEVEKLEKVLFNLKDVTQLYNTFRLLGTEQARTVITQVMDAANILLNGTISKDAKSLQYRVGLWQKEHKKEYNDAHQLARPLLRDFINTITFMKWVNSDTGQQALGAQLDNAVDILRDNAAQLYFGLVWQSSLKGMNSSAQPDQLEQLLNHNLPQRLWPTSDTKKKCQEVLNKLMNCTLSISNMAHEDLTVVDINNSATLSNMWESCEKQYEEVLAKIKEVIETILLEINSEISSLKHDSNLVSLDFEDEKERIFVTVEWFESLVVKYAEYTLTRLDLANEVNHDVSLNVTAEMSSIRSKLVNNAVSPLRVKLRELKSKINLWYMKILGVLVEVEGYFPQGNVENYARNFQFMRSPYVAWYSSDIVQLSLQKDQLWRIWPTGTKLKTFLQSKAKPAIKVIIDTFMETLLDQLDQIDQDLMQYQSKVTDAITQLQTVLQGFKEKVLLDKNFIFNNFLRLDIYFAALKYEAISQMPAYTIVNYFSEMGGYMGLLVGASCLTLCEVLDLIVYNSIIKCMKGRAKKRQVDSQICLTNAYENKRALTPVGDVY